MSRPVVLPPVRWPVVELLFELGGADDLHELVRSLATIARPSAPDHTNVVAARLLSSPRAPESYLATRETHVPFAVVLRDPDDVDHPVSRAATALVTLGEPAGAFESGDADRRVHLSPRALRCADTLPVPMIQRAALQRRGRLPEPFVLTVGRPDAPALADAAIRTGLRVATVADVSGPWAIPAMALATPVVTDRSTADAIGAVDGVHLVVAEPASAATVARDLATDPDRCRRLARGGRELVEQHHDADRVARDLARRLGLVGPDAMPTGVGVRLADRLRELGTPMGHPIEMQLADRLGDLGVAPRAGGSWR